MTVLSPISLLFLALVPLIILFYILRAQYERVEIPSTLLWRNVVRDTEGRPTWRKPIRNVLLLLQLLAAIVGALTLARPATLGQSARNHILVLDASVSMQATDVAPSRFDDAKRQASDVVRSAQEGDAFAVLRMSTSVDLVESGKSRLQALQAISASQPGVSGGDIRAALQVAGAIARERNGFRNEVTIFSDGSFVELPPLEGGLADVTVRTVGNSTDNQAIVQVRVRRSLDGSNRYEGFARVFNYATTPIEVPVRALADGVPIDSRKLKLPARGSQDLIVPLQQSVKLLEVTLDRADVLALDNYAQVVVPSDDVDVTLVSPSAQFLERALNAVPKVTLASIKPQQYKRELVGAITVFDGFVPRTRDLLPAGAMLIVNPPPGSYGGLEVAELKAPQQIVRINPRSPLLDAVDLTGAFVPRALKVSGPPGTSPAVESRDAGLVWDGLDEGRKTVIFGFDPRQPEIGQRLAFPLMLANAVSWLAPNAGSPTLSPGQTINVQPLRAAKDVLVRDPTGKSYVFPLNDSNKGKVIPFAQTDSIGRYAILQRGPSGALAQSWFTVNAGEETHSDVRPRTFPQQTAGGLPGGIGSAVKLELWPFLATLLLGLLSFEWLTYVRR